MSYTFHTDIDPEEMDAFVLQSDQNTLMQTSPWAKVKQNWEPVYAGVTDEHGLAATALILFRHVSAHHTLAYIARGPVMDYHNAGLVRFTLDHIRTLAQQKQAFAVRFDPLVLSRLYPIKEKDQDHPLQNEEVIRLLQDCGCTWKGYTKKIEETTQPRFEAYMQVDEHWRDRLIKNTRQSIRTAEKRGVEVFTGAQYLPEFEEALHGTEQRQQIALRTTEYFRNMLEAFGDQAVLAVARLNFSHQHDRLTKEIRETQEKLQQAVYRKDIKELTRDLQNLQKELERNDQDWQQEQKEEVTLCGKLVCFNEKRMDFFYMGNNSKYMRVRANYYLYARFLDDCAARHIPLCCFGGVEGTLDDGLTQFKSAWPIDIAEYIGEFNMVLNPFWYKMFDRVWPFLRQSAGRLRGHQKQTEKHP